MKYLTFMLADQWCAVELASVCELLGYMPFTFAIAPQPTLAGSFDLRGQSARVVDLRVRLAVPVTRTDDTVMIIVRSLDETVAMIVDRATGLENIESLSALPGIHISGIAAEYIQGTVMVRGRLLQILNLTRTLHAAIPQRQAA